MHQAQLTALSVRQDGKGFKASLPEDGEQWLSLPDNLVGKVDWKSSYNVGWTKTPRKTGGFFYNVKELTPAAAPAGHSQPSANGNGQPLPHSYKDLDIASQAIAKVFGPLIIAREVEGEITKQTMAEIMLRCEDAAKLWWRSRTKAAPPATLPPPVEDIEDTF